VEDTIWIPRGLLGYANYQVLAFLTDGDLHTNKEIYAKLKKNLTRKSLILSLKYLALRFDAIEAQPVMTERGWENGFRIKPDVKVFLEYAKHFSWSYVKNHKVQLDNTAKLRK
jgi:hypothetical protein